MWFVKALIAVVLAVLGLILGVYAGLFGTALVLSIIKGVPIDKLDQSMMIAVLTIPLAGGFGFWCGIMAARAVCGRLSHNR